MSNSTENHSDRAHAVLSASGASRWLNCTPSARMCDGIEEESSDSAKEGTTAHELSENILRKKLGIISDKEHNLRLLEIRKSPFWSTDMEDQVEPYITLVLEQIAEARGSSVDALVLIEEKVSLETYIMEGFGTCDLIIIADGIMYIIDLKFGKGVRVSAIENSQLKLYGVGALEAFGMLYDIHTVRLTISQPRLDAISTWDISADDLMFWAEEYVAPTAKLAYAGLGETNPGDWCRFCKAKAFCPALREETLAIAEVDFEDISQDLDTLLEVYHVAGRVREFLSAVETHVYSKALEGHKWTGLKLVTSSGNRRIADVAKAIASLKKAGYEDHIYLNIEPKLKGLGDLKKNIGQAKMDQLLGKLIIKPEGKPALVDESDNRPEFNKADDFLD